MNAVLAFRPFETGTGATPGFYKIAGWIEDHHWRRGHAGLFCWQSSRAMKYPDVVMAVDRDAGYIAHFPFCGTFGPGRIDLELRHLGGEGKAGGDQHADETRSHGRAPYILLKPLRVLVTVKEPSFCADTLIQ